MGNITKNKIVWVCWVICLFFLFSFGSFLDNLYVAISFILLLANLFLHLDKFKLKIKRHNYIGTIWLSIYFFYGILIGYINGYTNIPVIISILETLCLTFSMGLYIENKERLISFFKCFVISGFLFALISFFSSPISTWGTISFGTSMGRGRNTLAFIVATVSIVSIYLYSIKHMKIYVFFSLFCVLVTLLTGSRKGILQIVIPIIIYIISQKSFSKKVITFIKLGAFCFIVMIFLFNNQIFMSAYGDRFMEMFLIFGDHSSEIRDSSTLIRYELAEIGWNSFFEKPITGWGLGASWKLVETAGYFFISYFHNNILEILACTGVIGFTLYFIPIIRSLFISFKYKGNDNFNILMLSIVIIYLILSFGQITVYYPHFYPIVFLIFQYSFIYDKLFQKGLIRKINL